MLRYPSILLAVLLSALTAAPARAVAPCSILDGPDCEPTVCSVLDPRPCLGDEDLPLGDNLQVTIDSSPAADAPKPDSDVSTLQDLFVRLRACWTPPPEAEAVKGMQMSVRVSFNRAGKMLAAPQLTYALPGVSAQARAAYRQAIERSLATCAPLHFTREFAGAIAGRPIMIRYVDNRDRAEQR